MLRDSLKPSPESLPPHSSRVSIAPRSEVSQRVDFAVLTDVGAKRQHNEDNYLVDRGLHLFVVCDGMGGHQAGEVASAMAVRSFRDSIASERELLAGYAGLQRGGTTKQQVIQTLQRAVNRASQRVFLAGQGDANKRGMGTTLVAALVIGNHAFIVHVGDSRAYLLRSGELEQLTRDHNVLNDLIRQHKLNIDGLAEPPPRNAITRAVGVYEYCEPDTLVIDLALGDRLLLCTDGLSDYFPTPQAEKELAQQLSEEDAQNVVGNLIQLANHRGGKDNITALVITLGVVGKHDRSELSRLETGRRALAKSPLFDLLSERELYRVLEAAEVTAFRPRQLILDEGEPGENLFLVLSGGVDVMHGATAVAHLKAGEHFGEMSLVRDRPRSARAVATECSELLVIRREDLFRLLESEHELGMKLVWRLTGVLADRLAHTTSALSKLRGEPVCEDITLEAELEDEDDARATAPRPFPFAEQCSYNMYK